MLFQLSNQMPISPTIFSLHSIKFNNLNHYYNISNTSENIGESKEDRKFPFNGLAAFLDSEATKSPKFEIMYFIEVISD